MVKRFDQKIKDKRFICKPNKGHINASVVPQGSNYPIALLNRFDVLQHEEDEVEAHELENNVVAPAATNTSSFKGNKNGNGPNWAMVAATGGSYNTHMGHFNKIFKGNKNKTGQTLGKRNSCDDNSCTNTHKSVQHEINGQQHTSLQFLGNKNGIGSKLGSVLSSVYTEGDTVKNDYAPSVKELHHCHGKLSFRGNKNGNGQTLAPDIYIYFLGLSYPYLYIICYCSTYLQGNTVLYITYILVLNQCLCSLIVLPVTFLMLSGG